MIPQDAIAGLAIAAVYLILLCGTIAIADHWPRLRKNELWVSIMAGLVGLAGAVRPLNRTRERNHR